MINKKVLIVDDSSTDLQHLKGILHSGGYRVITAISGKEAISKAAKELPDLILLDIIMDDIDGYRACREIKRDERTGHIPIVFVSSKSQRADVMWAMKQGGQALVSKPYSEEQIMDQVQNYV